MRVRSRLLSLVLLLGWGRVVWAAPSTTLTIDPSATSGSTITAADENDRNNDITTWSNAHDHTDISQTANTLNLGDGTAGTKSLCANAADSTDLCIRWDDTNNVWTIETNASTNDDMIIRSSGTSGLTSGQVLLGDGVGAIRTIGSYGTTGQELQSQGTGSVPTWATASGSYKVGNFTRDMTAASGSVAYTGVGFKPKVLYFFAYVDGTTKGSWGTDDGTNRGVIYDGHGITADTFNINTLASITAAESSTQSQTATVSSLDTDGFTLSWTKSGTTSAGTLTVFYLAGR